MRYRRSNLLCDNTRRLLCLISLLAAMGFVACGGDESGSGGGPSSEDEGDEWQVDTGVPDTSPSTDTRTDTRTDTARDTGGEEADGGGLSPTSTTFKLTNNSNGPVRLTRRSSCLSLGNSWISVRDATSSSGSSETFQLENDCTECTCRAVQSDSCAVCDLDCASAGAPLPITLNSGETQSWTWSGVIFEKSQVENQSCRRRELPPDRLEARFCWTSDSRSQRAEDCTSVEFTYGDDTEVSHTIQPKAKPQETTFRLVNNRNSDIYIQRASSPCSPGPEWMSVRDNGQSQTLATSCRTCSCDSVRSGNGCAACGVACQPGPAPIQSISPGQSVEWDWQGWFYNRKTVQGRNCTERQLPARETYDVRMCWSDTNQTDRNGELQSRECKTLELEYGTDSSVVHNVRNPTQTEFQITNRSNEPIQIEGLSCNGTPRWLTLSDQQSDLTLSDQCRYSCRNARMGAPRTACACSAPRVKTIMPGQSTRWVWDGRVYEREKFQGDTCWEPTVLDANKTIDAEFCWKKGKPSSPKSNISNPTCETQSFEYGRVTTVSRTVN